jgi:acetoacetate decarboxylase
MHNTRHFPAYDGLVPDVFELVRAGGYDREITDIWEGEAMLQLGTNTIEDLQAIAPKEILKGYRFTFAYTVKGGQVLLQHDKAAHR